MIVRYEHWGAWVKLEREAALVAIDRAGARALGLDGEQAWNDETPPRASMPLEVHVAVTSRCAAGCEGCYLDARPDGVEPPFAEIERTFDALARAGVFTVAFGGGEPTLRDDLGALADAARARGLTPVVTTSGLGLGEKKIRSLTRFAQVNVSYDGPGDAYANVRGFDGADAAESAIARLAQAGVNVGVNIVLTQATFAGLAETIARARQLGAREAQLLRYKPQGRARALDYLARRLTDAQARSLGPTLRTLSETHGDAFRIRIDCALVSFLSADPEIASRPELLSRWGVLGCEAGSALGATRVDGTVLPCSFADPTTRHAREIAAAWIEDEHLAAFREFPKRAPEPCASCSLQSVCRGGCKIVSRHVDGVLGADPECPRVREARA